MENRKSTLEKVFFLGGLSITWNSLNQKVMALSSCEAEYIAITSLRVSRSVDCKVSKRGNGGRD